MDKIQQKFLQETEELAGRLRHVSHDIIHLSEEWSKSAAGHRYGITLSGLHEMPDKMRLDALQKVLWEIAGARWPNLEVDYKPYLEQAKNGIGLCIVADNFEDMENKDANERTAQQSIECAKRLILRHRGAKQVRNCISFYIRLWRTNTWRDDWDYSSYGYEALEALVRVSLYTVNASLLPRRASLGALIKESNEPQLVHYGRNGIKNVRPFKNGRLDVRFNTEELATKVLALLTST